MQTEEFITLVRQRGKEHYRDMPWRQDTRPYYVLVSEIMLQQTQVGRVVPKFIEFMEKFPTIFDLANAPLADVVTAWNGLGYNRRAKYLHEAARMIVRQYDGAMPGAMDYLVQLPGIGQGTAGAIMAYSFNAPTIFIETNIRTVYLHHFFADQTKVTDKQIRELLEQTIDRASPREFYWALMDYGSWLKQQGFSHLKKSSNYKKQAPLKGSIREVRGNIVTLLAGGENSLDVLKRSTNTPLFEQALNGLVKDGIVAVDSQQVRFATAKG